MRFILVLVIFAIILFSFWNYAGIKDKYEPHQGGTHYTNMVEGKKTPSPYCYRILIPMLSLGSTTLSYFWVFIGLAITAYGLYILTGLLGSSVYGQWLAALLFLSWPPVFFEIPYWFSIADPFAYAALVFSAVFILKRQYWYAIAFITLGCLSKEVALIAIPFMFIIEPNKWKHLLKIAWIPVAVWLLVVLIIEPTKSINIGEDNLDIIERFSAIRNIRAGGLLLSWSWTIKSLIVLGPLFLVGLTQIKDKKILWFLSALLFVFVAGDTTRILAYTIPVLFPLAAIGLDSIILGKYRLMVTGILLYINNLRI